MGDLKTPEKKASKIIEKSKTVTQRTKRGRRGEKRGSEGRRQVLKGHVFLVNEVFSKKIVRRTKAVFFRSVH